MMEKKPNLDSQFDRFVSNNIRLQLQILQMKAGNK
jgi:hypothetical protein